MSQALVPVEFTDQVFNTLEGTWFRWKDDSGRYHPRSWYKPDTLYGVFSYDLHHTNSGRVNYIIVYKLKKDGTPDHRKVSMSFHKSQLKIKPLVLAEQNLL